jgi:hypothetical protein
MSEVKAKSRLAKVVLLVDAHFGREPLEVVVNRGSEDGVKLGDRFLVFGIGPHITDPETGDDLGALEIVRGRGEVVHVQDKIATVRSTERSRTRPAKRIIRESANSATTVARALRIMYPSASVIEEEIAPEAEVPFDSVQLGDLAKPI